MVWKGGKGYCVALCLPKPSIAMYSYVLIFIALAPVSDPAGIIISTPDGVTK